MPAIIATDHILVWKVTEDIDTLYKYLNKKELAEVSRYKSQSRVIEYCATRAALKELAGEKLEISHSPSGKPYIAQRPELNISISHTKGYVAVYLGDTDKGIDIEYTSHRAENVKSMFMSDEEISHIDKNRYDTSITIHWSAKEAIYKVVGHESFNFKENIKIEPFNVRAFGIIKAATFAKGSSLDLIVEYILTKNFVLTLAQTI